MGGADTAVARDTMSMNTNPAGLTKTRGMKFDLNLSLLNQSETVTDYADLTGANAGVAAMPAGLGVQPLGGQYPNDPNRFSLNTDHASEGIAFPLINLGYAVSLTDSLVFGLGFFTAGGMGAKNKGLQTAVDPEPDAFTMPFKSDVFAALGMDQGGPMPTDAAGNPLTYDTLASSI